MTLQHHGLRFHHFGMAVRTREKAISVLRGMGYKIGEQVHDPVQEVMLTWCCHQSMPSVELVAPSGKPGPLDNILTNHAGLIYHLCYSSVDAAASIASIRDSGVRVITISKPKEAILFGGRRVGFYQLSGFGLIEILEDA